MPCSAFSKLLVHAEFAFKPVRFMYSLQSFWHVPVVLSLLCMCCKQSNGRKMETLPHSIHLFTSPALPPWFHLLECFWVFRMYFDSQIISQITLLQLKAAIFFGVLLLCFWWWRYSYWYKNLREKNTSVLKFNYHGEKNQTYDKYSSSSVFFFFCLFTTGISYDLLVSKLIYSSPCV